MVYRVMLQGLTYAKNKLNLVDGTIETPSEIKMKAL